MENEQKFLVSLNNGTKFVAEDVNLKNLKGLMSQRNIFAVKIGNKSFTKHLIGFISKLHNIESEGNNVVLNLNNELLYTNVVGDVIKAIEDLTNNLNKDEFVLFNEEILFNRQLFQYTEESEVQTETQSND